MLPFDKLKERLGSFPLILLAVVAGFASLLADCRGAASTMAEGVPLIAPFIPIIAITGTWFFSLAFIPYAGTTLFKRHSKSYQFKLLAPELSERSSKIGSIIMLPQGINRLAIEDQLKGIVEMRTKFLNPGIPFPDVPKRGSASGGQFGKDPLLQIMSILFAELHYPASEGDIEKARETVEKFIANFECIST